MMCLVSVCVCCVVATLHQKVIDPSTVGCRLHFERTLIRMLFLFRKCQMRCEGEVFSDSEVRAVPEAVDSAAVQRRLKTVWTGPSVTMWQLLQRF